MNEQLQLFLYHPLFGIALTVVLYSIALSLHKRWRWLHPLFLCTSVIIIILVSASIPYEAYAVGGRMIEFMLGPATVALGVPLYKQMRRLKRQLKAIVTGVTIGSVASMASVAAIIQGLGGSDELMWTMLPKSVTSPIAIELARQTGGIAELGAVFAVLAGLLGSMAGPLLLRKCGVNGSISIGTAIGTSSHGIGTARLIREDELAGSVSGFAMALTGVITALLYVPVQLWLV